MSFSLYCVMELNSVDVGNFAWATAAVSIPKERSAANANNNGIYSCE